MNIIIASVIVWFIITYIVGVIWVQIEKKLFEYGSVDDIPRILVGLYIETLTFMLVMGIYGIYTAFQTVINTFVFGG